MLTISSLTISVWFLYQGDAIKKIFSPIILLTLTSSAELISSFLFDIAQYPIYADNNYLSFGLLANINVVIITMLFLKIANLKNKSTSINAFYNIFIISLLPFLLCVSILKLDRSVAWIGSFAYLILIIIIWLVIDYILYRQAIRLKKVIKEELIMTGINDYYQQTLHRYIEIKEDSDDYRKIRHDLINYIERIKLEDKHE